MNRILDRSAGERAVQACASIARLELALGEALKGMPDRQLVDYAHLADLATRMLYEVAQFNALQQAANEVES